MTSEIELKKAKDNTLRKIGGNLLLFQQVEQMIKWLLANRKIQGFASEIQSIKIKQAEAVKKLTLGNLVGRYIESHQSATNIDQEEGPAELKEPFVTISFCLYDDDKKRIENKREILETLVAERNELIHHLLPRINPYSIESWQETERYLDSQREKIVPEFNNLLETINAIRDARKEMAEYIVSDKGKQLFEVKKLHQEHSVCLLSQIASTAARHDGWTKLSTAGHLIQKEAPGELASLKKSLGVKTLKKLILTTGMFEIIEEVASNGGRQTLYRLKPE